MENFPALQMMQCETRQLRLSVPGCAKLWLSANGKTAPDPWESRAACRGCQLGAKSAGREIQPMDKLRDLWRSICSRCLKFTNRMVGRMHCIGCYNRQREAIIGRNAKGTRPALADQLRTVRMRVVCEGVSKIVVRPHVTSALEAMIQAARDAKGPMMFSRPRPVWPGQIEMGLPMKARRVSGSPRKNMPPPRRLSKWATIAAPGQMSFLLAVA